MAKKRVSKKDVKKKQNQYANPGDPVAVYKDGKVVKVSQNLRVLTTYNREESSFKSMTQDGNKLLVRFNDGATVRTKFSDPSLLSSWITQKSGDSRTGGFKVRRRLTSQGIKQERRKKQEFEAIQSKRRKSKKK